MKILILVALTIGCVFGQTTVTLNGLSYTTASHPRTLLDGPSGVINTAIKDPDGAGSQVAPKANNLNPAWVALSTNVNNNIGGYQSDVNRFYYRDGALALQFAIYFYSDNSQTAARDAALYMLNHIEYYVPFVCVETAADCTNGGDGYGITSYGISYWVPNWIMTYELMRDSMTTQERHTFADKMLNDKPAWGGIDGTPSVGCTNPTTDSGATVTLSNQSWSVSDGSIQSIVVNNDDTITVTLTGLNTGITPGNTVTLVDGSISLTYPVYSIAGSHQIIFGATYQSPGDYTISGATLTYNAIYASSSNPVFGTSINQGDWIFTNYNNSNTGIVSTILDSSHAYLTGQMSSHSADELFYRTHDWVPGDCGFLWHVKHDDWTPQVIASTNGSVQYPPSGGLNGLDSEHNLVYSALWGIQMMLLSVIDDDVNANVRSGFELTKAYNWWYANDYTNAERLWTGFHQSGSGYGLFRTDLFMPGTAIAIQNSIVSAPALMNGIWAKNLMIMKYANAFPDATRGQMQWGQPEVSGANMTPQNLAGFVMLASWFRNTNEGKYANWWLHNLWSYSGFGQQTFAGQYPYFAANALGRDGLSLLYIFTDSSFPSLPLSGAPTTYLFNQSDTGSSGHRADTIISRTGFSPSDTLINFYAQAIDEYDHNVDVNQPSNYASYKIFKGNYLLAEDYNINFNDPAANGFSVGGQASNYVQIGGSDSTVSITTPIQAGIKLSAGNNDYAYGMADVSHVYVSNANVLHAYRHLIDFKKTGSQQFIIDYMDYKTSSGTIKKAFYHYPNLSTTTLTDNVVNSNNNNGITSQLLTKVLSPQQVLITQDTSGTSFRMDVCPTKNGSTCDSTNIQSEMLVVHMPSLGSGNTVPNISLISSIDSRFQGVEIDGSSPKNCYFSKKWWNIFFIFFQN